jgi:hypothetical protein
MGLPKKFNTALKLEKSISYNSARDSYGGDIEATIKPRKRSQNNFCGYEIVIFNIKCKKVKCPYRTNSNKSIVE